MKMKAAILVTVLLFLGCGSTPDLGSGQQQTAGQKEKTEIETKGDVKTKSVQTSEQKQQQSSVESKEIKGDVETRAYQLDKQRRKLREQLSKQRQMFTGRLMLIIVGVLLIAANTERWFPLWLSPWMWIVSVICIVGGFGLSSIFSLL